MPDNEMIQRVGAKWQAWADTLSSDEKETLAKWWSSWCGDDVTGYSAGWWESPGAWSNAWSESWSQWSE